MLPFYLRLCYISNRAILTCHILVMLLAVYVCTTFCRFGIMCMFLIAFRSILIHFIIYKNLRVFFHGKPIQICNTCTFRKHNRATIWYRQLLT